MLSPTTTKSQPVRKALLFAACVAVALLLVSIFSDHTLTPGLANATKSKLANVVNSSSGSSACLPDSGSSSSSTVTHANARTVNGKPVEIEFMIPLTTTHFNFCRSLYTALMNDYPKPTLINWGKTFIDAPQARVRKINGINEHLNRLRPEQFALINDGFDVWYQMPYREFVSQFLEVTYKEKHNIVMFGADKKCWPNEESSAACSKIPESTLPKNAYGPDTDDTTKTMNTRLRYINNRPRWLNSGNMVGPVSVLRQIYERANHSISIAPPELVYSDQMYIAEVFGNQDLSMGIDYKSQLFQTMTFSHRDIIFLEDDLMSTPRKPPKDRRWYAFNKISGAVPPIIHFNGPKEAMDLWWPKFWWYRERNSPAVIAKSKEVYETGGAFTTEGEFLSWKELCGDTDVHSATAGRPV